MLGAVCFPQAPGWQGCAETQRPVSDACSRGRLRQAVWFLDLVFKLPPSPACGFHITCGCVLPASGSLSRLRCATRGYEKAEEKWLLPPESGP